MQSLTPLIKTWCPEIPNEDAQQIIGVCNTFHHACIESCKSYPMTRKNWMGMYNYFNLHSPVTKSDIGQQSEAGYYVLLMTHLMCEARF